MKTITLRPGDKEVLIAVCQNAQDGLTISEIRLALKTIDAIEKAGDTVLLDDAYQAYLASRFAATKFVKVDAALVDLMDRIS